jgi:hypothetical protein
MRDTALDLRVKIIGEERSNRFLPNPEKRKPGMGDGARLRGFDAPLLFSLLSPHDHDP